MVNLYRVIDNLIGLVESKYNNLKEIYLLTEKQTIAIANVDMTELMELIDKKQQKIDVIENIDLKFESITNDIKTIYEIKSLDELDVKEGNILELREKITAVTELLKEIIQIENNNKENMNKTKQELEKKMNKAQTGKAALKHYGGYNGYADAMFFDKKIK